MDENTNGTREGYQSMHGGYRPLGHPPNSNTYYPQHGPTNKGFLEDTWLGRPWTVILCRKWRRLRFHREKASMLELTSHPTIEATIPCTATYLRVHIRTAFLLHQPRPHCLCSHRDPLPQTCRPGICSQVSMQPRAMTAPSPIDSLPSLVLRCRIQALDGMSWMCERADSRELWMQQ
jgi:hypothetical protein